MWAGSFRHTHPLSCSASPNLSPPSLFPPAITSSSRNRAQPPTKTVLAVESGSDEMDLRRMNGRVFTACCVMQRDAYFHDSLVVVVFTIPLCLCSLLPTGCLSRPGTAEIPLCGRRRAGASSGAGVQVATAGKSAAPSGGKNREKFWSVLDSLGALIIIGRGGHHPSKTRALHHCIICLGESRGGGGRRGETGNTFDLSVPR